MRPTHRFHQTALAAAVMATLHASPALAAQNDISANGIEGVTITSNGDRSDNGEGFLFVDGGQIVFQTNQSTTTPFTEVASSGGLILRSDSDSFGGGAIALVSGGTNLMNVDTSGISIARDTTISGALSAYSLNTGSGTIQTTGTVSGGTGSFSTVNASNAGIANLNLTGGLSNSTGNVAVNDNLAVSGTTATQGLSNVGSFTQTGTTNINTNGVGGATSIGGVSNTNSVAIRSGASLIEASNGVNIISGAFNDISGHTAINSSVDAATTIGSLSNTSAVSIYSGASELLISNGYNMLAGTLNYIVGETTINTTGSAATTIGSSGNTSAVTIHSGAATIQAEDGVNTIAGTTNNINGATNITGATTVVGATSINTTGSAATTIGSSGNTSAVTLVSGAGSIVLANGVNTIAGPTNVIGASTAYATVNEIGTGNAYASTNTIGNSNSGSTVAVQAGSGYVSVNNTLTTLGTGSGGMVQTAATGATLRASSSGSLASNGTSGTMAVNGGGGYTAYQASQTVAAGSSIGNILTGATYTNQINGNLFVDGNVYINGTLNYVSSNAANTSVVGGGSVLDGAAQGTTGGTAIVLKDTSATHTTVDANGRLATATGVAAESVASLTLTNGYGETHGIVVTERQTTISGGTRSTSLTLDDNGATFSNSANGQPVQVHGVADGTADFDAVNVRQLRAVKRGLAATAAIANVPMVDTGRSFSFGMGVGGYDGEHATAVGVSARPTQNLALRASVGHAFSGDRSGAQTTWGVGASYSW